MEILFYLPWVLVLLIAAVRQVNQFERGVKLTLGKFSGLVQPGWRIVVPIFQSMKKVDIRVKAADVPDQEAITRDNVSCRINAVIYYKVVDAGKAILEVENVWNAISQLAQTTMRNVVGELTLDELLSQRDQASTRIKEIVESHSEAWGLDILNVELKDIQLPDDMKRTIGKQAEAERERRAVIISSEGEVSAAENLSKAAAILAQNPSSLHLRTLNSINDISSDKSNTVIFTLPLEVLKAFEKLTEK
ncbi:slipin family protein [Patescibacteria group bacterium]|nr:slipin family protein [Patescibacteria group bacterium]MBU1034953.1 slipin family protein [Patescibacteria group bacterium]MBU1629714.1 slipin family protein [Patescibacteria group bacterium]MBU1908143.1 slipin family protein [Patescibacteria group bacterium]